MFKFLRTLVNGLVISAVLSVSLWSFNPVLAQTPSPSPSPAVTDPPAAIAAEPIAAEPIVTSSPTPAETEKPNNSKDSKSSSPYDIAGMNRFYKNLFRS
jgi:hypothetical protein